MGVVISILRFLALCMSLINLNLKHKATGVKMCLSFLAYVTYHEDVGDFNP